VIASLAVDRRLSPRIPNCNLEKCHQADPLFQAVKPITLFSSMRSFSLLLWDEERKKPVGYRHLKALRKQRYDPPRP
jgi:omega-6 fatty acid desaturase (delta-12 desaturase)